MILTAKIYITKPKITKIHQIGEKSSKCLKNHKVYENAIKFG